MSRVIENGTYNWTTENYHYNVICYTQNTTYKLYITITNTMINEVTTTHRSEWKQLGDKLDVIVDGLSNNDDNIKNLRSWNTIFYDLHAKFGIGVVFNVNSPLFARFYTNNRNRAWNTIDFEQFNANSEIWLSCDTDMNVSMIMLDLDTSGYIAIPVSHRVEYSGYWPSYTYNLDSERGHRIIENEAYTWAYGQIKQFYSQIYGKEILAIPTTFSHSLIRLIIDYVI